MADELPDPYGARPWRRVYPHTVPTDPRIPDMALTRLLDEAAARFPSGRALAFQGRSWRYDELRIEVERFATGLARLRVRPGDRVAIALPNCPQLVVTLYAVWRLGAIAVPANPLAAEGELRHLLRDSAADVVVCSQRAHVTVAAVRGETDVRAVVVVADAATGRRTWRRPAGRTAVPTADTDGQVETYAAVVRAGQQGIGMAMPVVDPGAVAVIAYTAGTTGPAKGAMLTHRNLVANCYQYVWMFPHVRAGEEVTVGVLPLFHVYGLTLCLNASILLGGLLVLVPGVDRGQLAAAVVEHRPTLFPAVAPVFRALLDIPELTALALASVRASIAVGMALPEEIAAAFERRTQAPLVAGFGLTETSPMTHTNPLNGGRKPGTVGVPLPMTEAMIVHPRDAKVLRPVGQVGELAVRGPQLFAGYWRSAPDPSARTEDGYLLTGDLARMDADGFFTVIDRRQDLITVDRHTFAPGEVEAVIAALPEVARAAVVAGGGGLVAFVQPHAGQRVDADAVVAACVARLTPHKVPGQVIVRERIPLDAMGKVLRAPLRTEVATKPPAPQGVSAPSSPAPAKRVARKAAKKVARKAAIASKAAASSPSKAAAKAPRKPPPP